MKKIICLLLCAAMLFSVMILAGCGKKDEDSSMEDITDQSSSSATTLTMYVVTKDETTEEAESMVSDAINKLTKAQYKTQVNFIFMTEDEYYATMEQLLSANEERVKKAEEAKKNKNKESNTETATETESETLSTETNEYGVTITRYPTVSDDQVDILYMGNLGTVKGYDKYLEYIENGWLAQLNAELSGSSKKLKSYISSALISAVQYNGNTYAIPNNNIIGSYTYMLIDKEMYDKLYYTAEIENVKTIMDLADFLSDVHKYYPDVLPINSTYEYCMNDLAYYWDISVADHPDGKSVQNAKTADSKTTANFTHHSYKVTGDFSVIGYAYTDLSTISRGKTLLSFDSLFTNKTYVTNFLTLADYKYSGYFGEPADGQKVAVSFVTGDASVANQYKDTHYVVTVGYPKVTEDDVYGNMFAVSAYTSSVQRSMEIITFLNTNKEVRNLLQYGLEGIHYELDENDVVTRLNHDYMMDIEATGNCFLAYPEEGMNKDVWDIAKEQNRVAVLNPLYGFSFDNELTWKDPETETSDKKDPNPYGTYQILDETLLTYISNLSDTVWGKITACQSYDELETLVTNLQKQLSPRNDAKIGTITDNKMAVEEPETDEEGNPVEKETEAETEVETDREGNPIYTQTVEIYTPFVIYFNWLSKYGYLPAGYGADAA